MNLKYYFIACSILFICFACQNTTQQSNQVNDDFQELPTPSQNGGEPNLFVSEKGLIYLSWVEYLNDTTDALVFSTLEMASLRHLAISRTPPTEPSEFVTGKSRL